MFYSFTQNVLRKTFDFNKPSSPKCKTFIVKHLAYHLRQQQFLELSPLQTFTKL